MSDVSVPTRSGSTLTADLNTDQRTAGQVTCELLNNVSPRAKEIHYVHSVSSPLRCRGTAQNHIDKNPNRRQPFLL
jgi:hypothetical protein